MLFNNQEEINQSLQGIVNWDNDNLIINDTDKLRTDILDRLVLNAAINSSPEVKGLCRYILKLVALELGIVTTSIQGGRFLSKKDADGFAKVAINIQ